MRLRKISSIKAANAFIPEYMAAYNKRFAIDPRSNHNAHREVQHNQAELDLIFTRHEMRKLSKNLTFQCQNREYQIQEQCNGYRMRQAGVTVCESFDGVVTILYKGHPLKWKLLAEGERPVAIEDEKCVQQAVDTAKERQRRKPHYKPRLGHPWNKAANLAVANAEHR